MVNSLFLLRPLSKQQKLDNNKTKIIFENTLLSAQGHCDPKRLRKLEKQIKSFEKMRTFEECVNKLYVIAELSTINYGRIRPPGPLLFVNECWAY